MTLARDHIGEAALIQISRAQREALDRLARWQIAVVAAGYEPDEARQIVAEVSNPERERAAA